MMTLINNVIEHPDLARFAIVRQDYLAITNNHCAAMLLSVIEGYTNWARNNNWDTSWIDLSGKELSYAMSGMFGRKAIMAAGVLLDSLDLIRRQQNNDVDRTYRYLLLAENVQSRIALATFWDSALKLISWRSKSRLIPMKSWLWFPQGLQWLETLWSAIVRSCPVQDTSKSPCIEPENTASIKSKNSLKTANNRVVVDFQEKEEDKTETQDPQDESLKEELSALGVKFDAVKRVIHDYRANVAAAVAYTKEAIATWKKVEEPAAVFTAACKEGRTPIHPIENVQTTETVATDWTQHPDWEEWLALMRHGISTFIKSGTCLDRQTRRVIAAWAEQNNLVWVGDYAL